MISGIGTDIIEIGRMVKAADSEGFMRKCFSADELATLGIDGAGEPSEYKIRRLAGRWAAKESVAKALGTGFSDFSPADVEILSEPSGKPVVRLKGNAKRLAESLGVTVHVSISHSAEYATATAIAEYLC